MNFIGIDPGLSGGLAYHGNDGLELAVMPVVQVGKKREIDEAALYDWLLMHRSTHVIIERVHSMPKQGVASTFTFGTGWGLVRGICRGLSMPYELVRPQEWQKAMLIGHPKGSEYLVASRLWPTAEWLATPRSRKPHEGLVDAALIMEFGRRRLR